MSCAELLRRVLPLLPAGNEVGLAQTGARGRQCGGRAALQLATDDLERQVLVALHGEHAHEAVEVVQRVQAVAGLGAPRRDQALLLEVAQLAHGHIWELGAQAVDQRADGEQLLVADVEQEFGGIAHGTMNVSLYLPICNSSPSASSALSVRRRLT